MSLICRYRLAPQHPYPEPFQDCFDAAKYFLENAREYDVDSNRIALAGKSRKPKSILFVENLIVLIHVYNLSKVNRRK